MPVIYWVDIKIMSMCTVIYYILVSGYFDLEWQFYKSKTSLAFSSSCTDVVDTVLMWVAFYHQVKMCFFLIVSSHLITCTWTFNARQWLIWTLKMNRSHVAYSRNGHCSVNRISPHNMHRFAPNVYNPCLYALILISFTNHTYLYNLLSNCFGNVVFGKFISFKSMLHLCYKYHNVFKTEILIFVHVVSFQDQHVIRVNMGIFTGLILKLYVNVVFVRAGVNLKLLYNCHLYY